MQIAGHWLIQMWVEPGFATHKSKCLQKGMKSMRLVIPSGFISWVNSFSDISRKWSLPNMIGAVIIACVNSHQRWKQTRFRVCFHLWCELTSTINVTEWQVSWNSCNIIGNLLLKHKKTMLWKKENMIGCKFVTNSSQHIDYLRKNSPWDPSIVNKIPHCCSSPPDLWICYVVRAKGLTKDR